MGRVRTKTVKRSARHIVEKYYSKLTMDFQLNKKISEEVAIIPSKRLRNKIAGFVTHLMKRIQKGPVRGISLKLQEAERERRMEYVPEKSELDVEKISVDAAAKDMMKYVRHPTNLSISTTKVGGSTTHTVRTAKQLLKEGNHVNAVVLIYLLALHVSTRLNFIPFFLGSSASTDLTSSSTRRELLMAASATKPFRRDATGFKAWEARILSTFEHSFRRT